MVYVFLAALLLLAFAPAMWAKWTLSRHGDDRADFPGTGGELAEHLIEELGLEGVGVEATEKGSHYDPDARMVRLEPEFYDGKSVSAIAVAAHEVGHAVQHHLGYRPLMARTTLVKNTWWLQQLARYAMIGAPVLAIATTNPRAALVMILIGVIAMGIGVVIHLVTLPVEFDASFGRALPVLEHGGYLHATDMPAATSVLRACALTYVGGALMTMFSFWTWFRALR